ncbi:uncharacterized protein CXorf49 homolog [Arvicola amphibius]|uniref:uncharacterized protein CXorf49 homolog n=1 Tax=Arvicola amphibius TaxID=1047088 RepID=UPI0018E392D6|nr:uncharacterized protein CXorf49 homolog [Arvicola amphibius]
MNPPEEASVTEDGIYVDGEDQTKSSSVEPRPAESSEGEGSVPGPKGSEFPLVSQLEVLEPTSVVLWAEGCWPDSPVPVPEEESLEPPVEEKVVGLNFLSQPKAETVASGQHVTHVEVPEAKENLFPEGFCAENETGSSRRGLQASGSEEAKPLFPKGLEQSRAWVTPRKSSRMVISEDTHHPISEPALSDELNEVQMMRVTICLKDGSQTKTGGPAETGDLARHSNVQARESFIRMPSSLLTPTPRGLTSGMERQASKELETFSSKKKQGVLWGKGGAKPSYPEAPGVGGLPKASPRKKMSQKKKPLWDASAVSLGKAFHQWGQRLKSAPAEPATFPPISGVGLPGRSNKCSLLPLRPKQCKNFYTGKRPGTKRTRDLHSVAKEETDSTKDSCSQVLFPTHRAEPSTQSTHQEFSGGDINARSLQDPANSQPLAPSQKGILSRKSASSGDQEPLVAPLPPDPEIQQLPGTQGCPRCPELQKEIENLKKQLMALQAVNEKFQALST